MHSPLRWGHGSVLTRPWGSKVEETRQTREETTPLATNQIYQIHPLLVNTPSSGYTYIQLLILCKAFLELPRRYKGDLCGVALKSRPHPP
jgi:hypothetical protein